MLRALLPLVVLVAPAVESPTVQGLKSAAETAFRQGDHLEALLFIEQAYALDPQPGLLGNKALILERLGQYPRALAAFEIYLRTDPPPEKRRVAEVAVERLRPEVLVVSDPPGASVRVDQTDDVLGLTPLRVRLVAGTHLLRVTRAGYREAQATLAVEPGTGGTAQVTLAPDVPDVVVGAGDPPDHGAPWSYVAMGTGVAAVATGGILFALMDQAADQRDGAGSLSAWHAHQDRAELLRAGGLVSVGLGAAAIGVGFWLFSADE